MDKIIELESERMNLEQINKLQEAFTEVKASYREHYAEDLNKLLTTFKSRMKNNDNISQVVNDYIDKYINSEHRQSAREELYNILGAEMLETFMTLSHTSCTIS
jgi:predicted Zn-dependent protease